MKFILAAICLINGGAMASTYSIGFFPKTFPRDPIDVNIYNEHLLVGQILEPLVESSTDGTVAPAVASEWSVSSDGKKITFTIRKNLNFSNGKAVTPDDVIFSLQRHLDSPNSQSRSYLSKIQSMIKVGENSVAMTLKSPYVAIFKALSREQLGIVPNGWKFDPLSTSPYIGTGPYVAKKREDSWYLEANPFYRDASKVEIKEWKVVQKAQGEVGVPVDYSPFNTKVEIDEYGFLKGNSKYSIVPNISFLQSMIWWYPHGTSYESITRQKLGMYAVHKAFEILTRETHEERATGLIPTGIAGHLQKLDEVKVDLSRSLQDQEFTVVVIGLEATFLSKPEVLESVRKLTGVTLKIRKAEITELGKIPDLKPDILVMSYAGGFHDPEGFLINVASFLKSDFTKIMAKCEKEYSIASQELDWSKRHGLYEKLNKCALVNLIALPGIRKPTFSFSSERLITPKQSLSYTLKFKNLKPKP